MPTLPWRATPGASPLARGGGGRAVPRSTRRTRSTPPAASSPSTRPGAPIAGRDGAAAARRRRRMAHCVAIGVLLGRPGADGSRSTTRCARCWTRHRDATHGGYFWSFDADGPRERDKLAYGHAFVLLAASSAKCAGHPDADRLLADITEVLNDAVLGGAARRQRRGIPRGLDAVQRLSRPERQHAPDRGADGGVRGDRRGGLSRQGREHRRPDPAPQRRARRIGACPSITTPTGAVDRRLSRLRHVPPLRLYAGPCARMDAARAAALGARRAAARLAAGRGAAPVRAGGRARLGRGAAGSITRSNTTARRACATGCGGRSARASAPRISSARSTATPFMKTGTAASGISPRGA